MKPRNQLTEAQAHILLRSKGLVRPKYNNKRIAYQAFFGEHTFDSRKESEEYVRLEAAWRAGELRLLLCQVPFRLPGKTKYVADFLAIWQDGRTEVIDVKGMKTPMYQLKKRQVCEIYRLKIEER